MELLETFRCLGNLREPHQNDSAKPPVLPGVNSLPELDAGFDGGLNHRKIIQLLKDVLPSGKQTVCETWKWWFSVLRKTH